MISLSPKNHSRVDVFLPVIGDEGRGDGGSNFLAQAGEIGINVIGEEHNTSIRQHFYDGSSSDILTAVIPVPERIVRVSHDLAALVLHRSVPPEDSSTNLSYAAGRLLAKHVEVHETIKSESGRHRAKVTLKDLVTTSNEIWEGINIHYGLDPDNRVVRCDRIENIGKEGDDRRRILSLMPVRGSVGEMALNALVADVNKRYRLLLDGPDRSSEPVVPAQFGLPFAVVPRSVPDVSYRRYVDNLGELMQDGKGNSTTIRLELDDVRVRFDG